MAKPTRSIVGGPTKRFFVSMLTKDIDLDDAILDLLDNCVDGAIRAQGVVDAHSRRYEGYKANLVFNEDEFSLLDNCGGIPTEVALKSAFRLGRPEVDRDADLPTIGMYGIGMKRAIFKMSKSATVETQNDVDRLIVRYGSDWLNEDNDQDWNLNLEYHERTRRYNGTRVRVDSLKGAASKEFSSKAFEEQLVSKISEYYGYIIEKGFKVTVNGKIVKPSTLRLYSFDGEDEQGSIQPYEYRHSYSGVNIRVVIGFRRSLIKGIELEDSLQSSGSSEDAGVSVICNDRIILLNDKSRVTGWGEGVAKYHNQFISIGGIIDISSNDSSKLPVSTTKRALEVGSDVFLRARERAIEGLKVFVTFTNKWKGREEDATPYFLAAKMISARNEVSIAEKGRNLRAGGQQYIPTLPVPEKKDSKQKIAFFRPNDEVVIVSEYIFDEILKPSEVGEAAFDWLLEEALRSDE